MRKVTSELENSKVKRSDKGERNTGYHFDLLDREKAERDEDGVMKDYKAQMGPYDTRHDAIGMKVLIENRFPHMDYEVRAFETMWREVEEPTECGYCGYETYHFPLVNWYFYENGPFCSQECCARYAHENGGSYP